MSRSQYNGHSGDSLTDIRGTNRRKDETNRWQNVYNRDRYQHFHNHNLVRSFRLAETSPLLDIVDACCLQDGATVGEVPVLLSAALPELFPAETLRRTHLELHLSERSVLHRALDTSS